MDAHTADRVFVLQKVFELEKTLSKLDLSNNENINTGDVLASIKEIKHRFAAQEVDNESSPQESEKKMERRLSLIGDKEMDALMNDILSQNGTNDENKENNTNNNDAKDEKDEKEEKKKENGDIQENNFDCIVAMAGGLKDDGSVHQWVANRLDLVYETYINSNNNNHKNKNNKNSNSQKPLIIATGGGTYHKPEIRGKDGWVIHESTSLARYLIKKGVNSNDIIREWASYDTIASVYFTFVTCIFPRNFENIAIVTSTFHMPRVKLLFEWIFNLHKDYYNLNNLNINLVFLEATDDKSEQVVIDARTQREKKSVENLKKLIKKLDNRETFHKWLFEEHKAYSCNFINEKRDPIPETLKKSY